MASDKASKDHFLQLYLGPLVGLLVLLFTFTEVYDRAELVTYDWRFNIRNNLFGLLPMDPRLGTIDINNLSVGEEGRYQDWTRDKYTEVVQILDRYDASMVGFDVYFIEPITKLVSEAQVQQLGAIDADSINRLFESADHDELFRQTIERAENVFLAQTIVVSYDELTAAQLQTKMVERTADKDAALEVIRQHSPRLMVDPSTSSIWRGFDFDPPLKLLRDATRGFAYAQTVPDVDGARRRYPLVYQYEDIVFPSIALLMVSDFLQVPINTVEVWPGEYVKLPGAQIAPGQIRDIEIPIDQYGNMNVNWAGKWDETFVHYPHIGLRWTAQRQHKQDLFKQIKNLVAADPELRKNLRGLPAALVGAGFTDQKANIKALGTWVQASGMEQAILQDQSLTAASFWSARGVEAHANQLDLFDQIKRNNRVADLLVQNPAISLEELQKELPDYAPSDIAQCEYYIRSILVDAQVPDEMRPLFFYPYIEYEGRLLTPDELKDKILFYGLTADGTSDLSVTPFQGSYPMVGIYPNVLNTILQGRYIHNVPLWLDWVIILGLGLLISLIVPRLRVLHGAALVLAVVLIYTFISFFAFFHLDIWVEMIGPMLTLTIGYLALTIYGYVMEEKEKDFVQGAFGHFLSPVVVDQIVRNPDMINQLGGQERVMTAFFSDIASFSTISERLDPVQLVNFINEYLSDMCDVIEEYGGTIDKFEGDAIVAFFGAPIFYEDHAVRACMSCIDQQHKLVELRQRWKVQGLPPRLEELRDEWEAQGRLFAQVRMGITAGPMVVGNMGSRTRTDYTMMGDTVNLAARFESGQKIYGTNIMINDQIYEQVKDQVEGRKLDLLQVMGKEEPVTAYEVLDRKGALSPEMEETLGLYAQGMEAYEAYNFTGARELFERALTISPKDGPSALYADRCEEFAISPPGDLIYRAESK